MAATRVRLASFADLDPHTAYRIWKLRVDVFVVEQKAAYPELDGRDDEAGTRHLWISQDDMPIAYLRILDNGSEMRIGRVCVAAEHRGAGLAAELMDTALRHVGGRMSVLDAQAHLARWYEAFGFAVCGPEFLDDGIPHIPMRRPAA
jgi:ElaA protein